MSSEERQRELREQGSKPAEAERQEQAASNRELLERADAERAAAATQALELELVGDAGHFVVDERPELVADRILRFFAKKPDA